MKINIQLLYIHLYLFMSQWNDFMYLGGYRRISGIGKGIIQSHTGNVACSVFPSSWNSMQVTITDTMMYGY